MIVEVVCKDKKDSEDYYMVDECFVKNGCLIIKKPLGIICIPLNNIKHYTIR